LDFIEELIDQHPILTEEILDPKIKTPLEGYLFAATYDFYEEEPTVESIIEMMLEKTKQVIQPYSDEMEAREMTMHEAVTFATFVEKEASTEQQLKTSARVFFNRLKEDFPL